MKRGIEKNKFNNDSFKRILNYQRYYLRHKPVTTTNNESIDFDLLKD